MDVIERRLELLKLEWLGFSRAEIVKLLAQKADCAERTVYNDFETRATWQQILQSAIKPEDVLLKIMNRYEQIYRQASRILHSESNPLVRLGALNTMLKTTSSMREIAAVSCKVLEVESTNKKIVVKMWRPNDEAN